MLPDAVCVPLCHIGVWTDGVGKYLLIEGQIKTTQQYSIGKIKAMPEYMSKLIRVDMELFDNFELSTELYLQ